MITEEESIKRGLKDIKEGRTFNEVQIRAISELLKIKDKEYSQKIKELENRIDKMFTKEQVEGMILGQRNETNQLKSQLNSHTEKIKEKIEFWNREKPQNLIVVPEKITELKTDDLFNFCRNLVVEELKSLLENEKE